MNKKINIIILIPYYNAYEDLLKSLKSISEITQVDVLIVDDGSKEKLDIDKLKNEFTQIHELFLIKLQENKGIETALNTGLKWIQEHEQYKYIARLDAGDTCHSDRFKIQSKFLDENPNIYLVGSWVNFVDIHGNNLFVLKVPTQHDKIKTKLYVNNMFIHPAVMFRREVIDTIGYYPYDFPALEDHAYFFDIANKYQTANIPIPLIDYEVNPNSISSKKRTKQVKSRIKLIKKHFYFGFYPIYGLIRSYMVLLLPRNLLTKIKQYVYK